MNELEARLTKLERTNKLYRVFLTLSLCVLGVVATTGFGQVSQNQQTGPRNIVADTITCTNLNAFSGTINQLGSNNGTFQFMTMAEGKADSLTVKAASVAALQVQRAAMGKTSVTQLDVASPNSASGIMLSATASGGSMLLLDNESRPIASLGQRDGGAAMTLSGKGGFIGVDLSADDKGGKMKTFNATNRMLVSIERNLTGDGEICTYSRAGNRVILLNTDDAGKAGRIIVQREGAFPMVKLESDAKGGVVTTMDEKVETARLPAKE